MRIVRLTDKQHIVCMDALMAWVALLTEEYHARPTIESANKMSDAVETLDRLKGRGKHYGSVEPKS
jgi:hypothetical protein